MKAKRSFPYRSAEKEKDTDRCFTSYSTEMTERVHEIHSADARILTPSTVARFHTHVNVNVCVCFFTPQCVEHVHFFTQDCVSFPLSVPARLIEKNRLLQPTVSVSVTQSTIELLVRTTHCTLHRQRPGLWLSCTDSLNNMERHRRPTSVSASWPRARSRNQVIDGSDRSSPTGEERTGSTLEHQIFMN